MLSKTKRLIKTGSLCAAMLMGIVMNSGVFAVGHINVIVNNQTNKELNIEFRHFDTTDGMCVYKLKGNEQNANICQNYKDKKGFVLGEHGWPDHRGVIYIYFEGRPITVQFDWLLRGVSKEGTDFQWTKTNPSRNPWGITMTETGSSATCFIRKDGDCDNTITLTIPEGSGSSIN